MRPVSSLDLGTAGPVSGIVIGTNGGRVDMFGDPGNEVGEIVQDPHDQGVRPLGFGFTDRLRDFEFPTGDHIALAGRRGTLAGGTLSGTVRCHIHSVRAEPHAPGRAKK
jgi:hypothetical protein